MYSRKGSSVLGGQSGFVASEPGYHPATHWPAADYIFTGPDNLDDAASAGGAITFTRASNGTRRDSSGILVTDANNIPRFDHDASGNPLGLLIEEARTNVCLQSEDFTTTWSDFQTTVTSNQAVAPDGAATADEFQHTDTSALLSQNITIVDGATSVFSVFLNRNDNQWVRVGVDDNGSDQFRAWFDVLNGVKGTASSTGGGTLIDSGIEDWGGGWYRVWIVGTLGAGDTTARPIIVNQTGDGSTTRDQTVSGYAWGAQLEAGAFPTSYIATTTTAVTRAADVATITGTNFSDWFNATEGTVIAEADLLAGSFPRTVEGVFAQIDKGSGSDAIVLQTRSGNFDNYSNRIRVAAANEFVDDLGDPNAGVLLKVALAYKTNDVSSAADGVILKNDTSVTLPTGLTTLRIGKGVTVQSLNGHMRRLTIYPTRRPDSELPALTA